eukprot:2919659-Prorocentrum_lima.AAC.1
MTSSLVGSEMCIRDSPLWVGAGVCPLPGRSLPQPVCQVVLACLAPCAVSYTHLTLPTICSV